MKQREQGRSMVEMLGVLAIIGVLSIGSIAGYTMAMNRYKANEILDLASKLSVAVQSSYASNPDKWNSQHLYSIHGSFGLDNGGSSEKYETTFLVRDPSSGRTDLFVRPQGVCGVLNSIIGNSSSSYTGYYEDIFNSNK